MSRGWLAAAIAIAVTMMVNDPASAERRWLAPVPLSTGGSLASEGATVAGDPAGNVIAVWLRVAGDSTCCALVEASMRAPGGVWSAPRVLSTPGRNAAEVEVAMDAGGDALVVWTEGGVVRHRTRPAGALRRVAAPIA